MHGPTRRKHAGVRTRPLAFAIAAYMLYDEPTVRPRPASAPRRSIGARAARTKSESVSPSNKITTAASGKERLRPWAICRRARTAPQSLFGMLGSQCGSRPPPRSSKRFGASGKVDAAAMSVAIDRRYSSLSPVLLLLRPLRLLLLPVLPLR